MVTIMWTTVHQIMLLKIIPKMKTFGPDDESSDGESGSIGDSSKSDKFTQQFINNKQLPQLLKRTKRDAQGNKS